MAFSKEESDSLGGDDTNNENYSYRLAASGYRLFSREWDSPCGDDTDHENRS
jgi:hypothetical protein